MTLERLNKLSNEWIPRDGCSEIEFVMVDDGSQDRTFELLIESSKADKGVKAIRVPRNFSHQAALLAGYEFAKGDEIVSLDADLQDPPELIKTMLDKIRRVMMLSMQLVNQEEMIPGLNERRLKYFIGS